MGSGVRAADCEGAGQKPAPAVWSEPPPRPELEAAEAVRVTPASSSFPCLHREGQRRERRCSWRSGESVGSTCVRHPRWRRSLGDARGSGLRLQRSLCLPLLFIQGGGQGQGYHGFLIQNFSLFSGLLRWDTRPGRTFSLCGCSLCAED